MFIRQMLLYILWLFAVIGALAVYRGNVEPPSWWLFVSFGIGSVFAAVFRDVPPGILAAHRLNDGRG